MYKVSRFSLVESLNCGSAVSLFFCLLLFPSLFPSLLLSFPPSLPLFFPPLSVFFCLPLSFSVFCLFPSVYSHDSLTARMVYWSLTMALPQTTAATVGMFQQTIALRIAIILTVCQFGLVSDPHQ